MTKAEKERYRAMETVSVCPLAGYEGLLIKAVEYGIEDYVVFVESWSNRVHRTKISSTGSRDYFRFGNMKIYTDDCLRV